MIPSIPHLVAAPGLAVPDVVAGGTASASALAGSLSAGSLTAAGTAAAAGDGTLLLLSAALMILTVGLILLEMFVISFGLLTILAAVLGLISLVLAAQVGTGAAVLMGLVGSVGIWGAIVSGLRVMRRSRLISGSTVEAVAGYQHAASDAGVGIGSEGRLTTAARPSGRARFTGGQELDVICDRSAEAGARIRITAIDGMGCTAQVIAD